MTIYHDWPGNPLAVGDIVLEESGLLWQIKEFNYGRENFALCHSFNGKGERAVDLSRTFRLGGLSDDYPGPLPNQKEGRMRYQLLYDSLLLGPVQEELRGRKRRFQQLRKRPNDPLYFLEAEGL